MPNLSRRHLVTTAAALPALASEAIGPNHPDAELLRLGAELEAVSKDWLAQRALNRWEHANAVSIDPDLERWGDINDRLFDLGDEILAHKASTPAGLAVHTQAIALMFAELWEDERDTDDDRTRSRLFVESVSSFLGIMPAPMEEAAREAVRS